MWTVLLRGALESYKLDFPRFWKSQLLSNNTPDKWICLCMNWEQLLTWCLWNIGTFERAAGIPEIIFVVTILEAFLWARNRYQGTILEKPSQDDSGPAWSLCYFEAEKEPRLWDSLFLANTVTHLLYYPELVHRFWIGCWNQGKLGISLDFNNLSGGIGVNHPEQEPNNIAVIGEGVFVAHLWGSPSHPWQDWSAKIFTNYWRLTELWSQESP